MSIIDWIVIGYCILFCAIWIVTSVSFISTINNIPAFEEFDSPKRENWPKLSIIIPACDEANTIKDAAQTVLSQDYPKLEVILINDRSTDNTGTIIDQLAASGDRVKVIHIKKLPEGWLGKVHALHVGTKQASGEWLLFTDADIHFDQGVMRKAIATVESQGVDHLAVIPKQTVKSFWLDVTIQAFGAVFLTTTKAGEFNKPDSKAIVGAGSFNLVKKSAFDKTEGFEWLKMEVVDDLGLGLMLKNAGSKSSLAISRKEISVAWYNTLKDMSKGLEKNVFSTTGQYSIVKLIIMVATILILLAAPVVAMLYIKVPYLWSLGVLSYASHITASLKTSRKYQYNSFTALLFPLGLVIMALIVFRAGILCCSRKEIVWRGTKYSIQDIIEGQRLKL